jgi:hypothetical protein
MLHLIDFPHRFSRTGRHAIGSIDEVSWLTTDTFGADAGAVPRGAVLYVRGWALDLDEEGPAQTVVVQIDGARTYVARIGNDRSDVAAQLGKPAFARCGFDAVIPTGRLDGGEHRVTVAVLDRSAGRFSELAAAETFTLLVPDRTATPDFTFADVAVRANLDGVVDLATGNAVDEPQQPFTVSRGTRLLLRGWACTSEPPAPFAELYALVDGRHPYRAAYGVPRPDVADAVGLPERDGLGFEVEIGTVDLERGAHECVLVGVTAGDGAAVRLPQTLRVIVGEALPTRIPLRESTLASIDDVVRVEGAVASAIAAPLRVVRGDKLFVRGWAIDEPAGTLAGGVVLAIDGEREVVALYGLPRADVAEALGKRDLMRCGFTAEIDSADLTTGIHTVTCRVLARDGRGAFTTAQHFAFDVVDI